MSLRHLGLAATLGALVAGTAAAGPPATDQLVGTFVGVAADEIREGAPLEQRDVVMELRPYRENGLSLQWNNVTLVDGRRDLPGVKFRRDEALLVPAPGRSFFLAGVGYDPFSDKPSIDPIRGDALRWGVADGDSLDLYSFAILDDGTYELQVTDRYPEGDGVALRFERIVDGKVLRRMTGRAVRAD
ncbi:MAG: hypothetical protein U1E52_10415 [Geminicoccaceae bacterium]